jgi:hypothetical protein
MFWPVRFALKLAFRARLLVFPFVAGMAVGLYLQLLEQQRTWAVRPRDQARQLPGDDIVAVADVVETRSLSIAAAPHEVWPWLVQMGWGRGGWYSYDGIDMDTPSADTILEAFGDLQEGDLVPAHPDGGFRARVVRPNEALVLYLDTDLVTSGAGAAEDEALEEVDATPGGGDTPAGLRAAGALGDFAMPQFRATWAFVLEPEDDGSTRLIERLRFWTGDAGLPARLAQPMMGLGVFAMTRKHMLGLKERAERAAKH